jgi:hypothetical protein
MNLFFIFSFFHRKKVEMKKNLPSHVRRRHTKLILYLKFAFAGYGVAIQYLYMIFFGFTKNAN